MKSDSWFPCYPADLLADTMNLNNHDFGAYMRLLCYYYLTGPVTDSVEELRQIAHCEAADWSRCSGRILKFFPISEKDGLRHNKRADEEIVKREEMDEKRRRQTEAARRASKQKPVTGLVTPPVTEPVTCRTTTTTTIGTEGTTNQPGAPSLKDVKTWAEFEGVPQEEAERFWNHFEASGWIDKNGHRIVNARAKLRTWGADSRAKSLEEVHRGPVRSAGDPYWKATKQLEQINSEINAIEFRASQTSTDMIIQPKDRETYRNLKTKRRELKKTLGLTA